MRRIALPALVALLLAAGGLLWHGRGHRPAVAPRITAPPAPAAVPPQARGPTPGGVRPPGPARPAPVPVDAPQLTPKEKYDAAIRNALYRLADHDCAAAQTCLEAARPVATTAPHAAEIDRLKGRVAQEAAARQTVRDIQAVLRAGRPEEAARLAVEALLLYGGTDLGVPLAEVKRQADTLMAPGPEGREVQRRRFRAEADAALRDKDLRGAVLALEELLQYEDEAPVRRQFDEVRAALVRYDDNRLRAAELRKDPAQLEEAVAALREAARAWDTVAVRQQIDDFTLALLKRRDRLAVADFEILGIFDDPGFGHKVAAELLPGFAVRYDPVNHAPVAKGLADLGLKGADLAGNVVACRQLGRLARLRYLVLGTIATRGCHVTVNARLVDVGTGLVVQTARVVAASPEEMMRRLPRLANRLMLTDEQKLADEQQQARESPPPLVVLAPELPPCPEVPAPGQTVPTPLITWTARPPASGKLRPEDFQFRRDSTPHLPTPETRAGHEARVKERLLRVAVELGDNLFRRGRYGEAHAQFDLALSLAPGHEELLARVEHCKSLRPPASAGLQPALAVGAPSRWRPRAVVFNPLVVGTAAEPAPPGFGAWAAEYLACQLARSYEIVDRGEAFWYMGRLGLTMRDVVTDPSARRWLARALDVRWLVFGVIRQGAGLDVTVHVVDAASGARWRLGHIHVQDREELKLRMSELARQTQRQGPDEVPHVQRETAENDNLIGSARRLSRNGEIAKVVSLCRQGLEKHPENIPLRVLLRQAEDAALRTAREEARRREWKSCAARIDAGLRPRRELARRAGDARVRAVAAARKLGPAERRTQEARRQRAHGKLLDKGRMALQQRRYDQAVQMLESAVALKPTATGIRLLAQARLRAVAAAHARLAAGQAAGDADRRRRRDRELAGARSEIARERRRLAREEPARAKEQDERDQATYAWYLGQGKRLLAQGQYEAALAALQSARQVKRTGEVEHLANQAHDRLARQRDQGERLARSRQLRTLGRVHLAAGEINQAVRVLAEAVKLDPDSAASRSALDEAEKARDAQVARARRQAAAETFAKCVEAGRQALARRDYEAAVTALREALSWQRGDGPTADLLRAAEKGRADAEAAARAQRQQEERRHAAEVLPLLIQFRTALAAHDLDAAARTLDEAARHAPADPAAQQARKDLEAAHQAVQAEAEAARKKAEEDRLRQARLLLANGQALLHANKLDAAAQAVEEARKLAPTDAAIRKAGEDVEKARRSAAAEADTKRRVAYLAALQAGQAALAAKRLDEAVRTLTEANRLLPTDSRAASLLAEAVRQRDALLAARPTPPAGPAQFLDLLAAGATLEHQEKYPEAILTYQKALTLLPNDPRAVAALKKAEFALHLAEGQKALALRHFPEAVREFEAARALEPGHPAAAAGLKQAKEGAPVGPTRERGIE